MLTLLSILLIALLIAASGTLAYAVKHANDGFEDDNGFHATSPSLGASMSPEFEVTSSNPGTPARLPKFMGGLPSL